MLGNGPSSRRFACFENGKYAHGNGDENVLEKFGSVDGTEVCQQKCQENPDCQFWFHDLFPKNCELLSKGIPATCASEQCIRAPRNCPQGKICSD